MRQFPFQDNRRNFWLQCLLLLGLMILSRDAMLGRSVIGFYPSQLATFALVGAVGLIFLICQRKNLKSVFTDPRIWTAAAVCVLLLVPMAVKRDWQLMYVSILFCILTAILVSYFMTLEQASRAYVTVMTILAAYSVVATYFLRILPDRGILPVPVFLREDDLPFYQFGLCSVSLEFVANRNFGIFREPGVYQFFLILGLFLNNAVVQWNKPWKLWTVNAVLALTVLSTFASGGIIELGLLAIFFFFDKKWYKDRRMQILAGLLILAVAGAAAYIILSKNALYEDLVWAFKKLGNGSDSSDSRMGSILVDLDIFLHHPIFGEKLGTVLHVVSDNTTSTMIQYAAFGFLTGSLHVLAWGVLAWDRRRNFFANCFLILILFMSFNTQNLIANPMFWLFPMMALVERGIPALHARKKRA